MLTTICMVLTLLMGCGTTRGETADLPDVEVSHWTCPMHPSVEEGGQVPCPICRMDLVAVTQEDLASGAVVIDAMRRQRYGVKTVEVKERDLTRKIRAAGTVRWDDSRAYDLTVRAMGWVEKLHITETGTRVVQGQQMVRLYSPDLYSAQRELLAHRGSERRRSKQEQLERLGFQGAQIAALLDAGVAEETVDLLSPVSGVVVELNAVHGTHLMEGALLARIARTDRVWVEAAVHEDDAPFVQVGSPIRVTVPGAEARYDSEVQRVEPWVDPQTRRLVVRASLDNPDGLLLANGYVDVSISVALGRALAVPVDAVVVTGERRIVFVDRGADRLVPQDIVAGRRGGDWIEVRSGLEAGDEVVRSGAFLVAAESRLKAAETHWGAEHAPE